jgi:phosphoserine phosphatase RsbU/P
MESTEMKASLLNDIQRGLQEKRDNISEWQKTVSTEEKQVQLGPVGEGELETHFHVIDSSLQKLEEGELGICTVCNEQVDSGLLQMDYTASVCLDHFSSQERRELENELELSQIVQRALLPQQMPSIQGLDVAAFSRPAQIIGGDYFDFLKFNDGADGFVIGDVSGKGVSAGMLISSLQTAFHTLVPENDSLIKILEKINRLYIHNINFTTFVTLFLGRIDPATQTLTYANAGHNPALLFSHAKKTGTWLQPTGAAIGLVEDSHIRSGSLQLEHGDILLLYTDGVTEAFNGRNQQFGEDRLANVIQQNAELSAEELIQKVLEALHGFVDSRPLVDDATLVISKVR